MNRIKQTIIALAIGLSLANCGDDFLDTTSSDQMSDSNTFTTIDGAQQVLTGAYDWLTNGWLAHNVRQEENILVGSYDQPIYFLLA